MWFPRDRINCCIANLQCIVKQPKTILTAFSPSFWWMLFESVDPPIRTRNYPPLSSFLPILPFLSLPNPARCGRALWAPPAWSGAEPHPKLNLVHFKWKIWHLLRKFLWHLWTILIKFGTNAETDGVIHLLIQKCQRGGENFPPPL